MTILLIFENVLRYYVICLNELIMNTKRKGVGTSTNY